MTDEQPTDEAVEATADGDASGTTVERVATPVEASTPAHGDDADPGATDRRTAIGFQPGRTRDPDRSESGPRERHAVRVLRLAISLTAVFGYVLSFGVAVGAVGAALESLRGVIGHGIVTRLEVGGALLLPAAAFLFVALYDDTQLTVPVLSDGHPPIVDAWLLLLAAFGTATVALGSAAWPEPVWLLGVAAAPVAAYLAAPVWLGRRCLRRPSWVLGWLAGLVAPLVLVTAVVTGLVLSSAGPAAVAVATVGLVLPYGLAYASPGPRRLASRSATGLGRTSVALRAAAGRVLGRDE